MTLTDTPIQGKHILVVDDEPRVAAALAQMLAEEGQVVDTAPDGSVALSKLLESSYDLILSDVRMPGLDGPGLYRALERSRPELLRRIVFMTGYAPDPGFFERTGVPYLSKPFGARDLRAVTQGVLRAG
jgi:two-component system NtrC family sensor kinase